MRFYEYLSTQYRKSNGRNLASKSVKNYYGAITGANIQWANENNIWQSNITDIHDVDTFRQIKEKIERLPDFQYHNSMGKNMYSRALTLYLNYLCFIYAS